MTRPKKKSEPIPAPEADPVSEQLAPSPPARGDRELPPAEALEWITPALRESAVSISCLTPDPKNARTHAEPSLAAITASLRQFGQVKPIIVNRRNNQVVAGNGTLEAAGRLGHSQIAVVWVDYDPATQHGFAIADNRSAEFAGWDQTVLDELLGEYSSDWGDDLYEALELDSLILPDEPDEVAAAPAAAGDARGGTDPADPANQEPGPALPPEVAVKHSWRVVIDCIDELQQEAIFNRLAAEGLKCRVLTL